MTISKNTKEAKYLMYKYLKYLMITYNQY